MNEPTSTPATPGVEADPSAASAPAQNAPQEPQSQPTATRTIAEIAESHLAAAESTEPQAGAAAGEKPETPPTPKDSATDTRSKSYSLQGALDHARQLKREGRLDELPPEVKGVFKALEDDAVQAHTSAQQQEREWRDKYVEMLALREEDPGAFSDALMGNPNLHRFMTLYQEAHPEVTLEKPDATPPAPDAKSIEQTVDQRYRESMASFVSSVAEEFSLPEATLKDIAAKGQGPFGALADIVNEAIKVGVEKGRAQLETDLRKAAETEAAARWAGSSMVVPRQVGGLPGSGAPASNSPKLTPMEAAYERAVAREQAS